MGACRARVSLTEMASLTAQAGTGTRSQTPPIDPDEENYYQLLNVPYTADGAEITRAYREAVKRAHPDWQHPARRAAAEETTKILNRAYATLSHPLKRQAYDKTIRGQVVQDQIMRRYVGGFAGPEAGGIDPFARDLRREPTAAERRDQARADRSAMVSVMILFTVATLVVVALLLLWAIIGSLFAAIL